MKPTCSRRRFARNVAGVAVAAAGGWLGPQRATAAEPPGASAGNGPARSDPPAAGSPPRLGDRAGASNRPDPAALDAELSRIARAPVLRTDFLTEPVRVASMELLKNGRVYLLRTRSTDGVEAITVPHQEKMAVVYPLFLKLVRPVFIDQDARQLETLLWDLYRHQSNYKLQGLALGVATAAAEMALLELLGRTAGRPLADFFGGTLRRDIAVYVASGNRGNRPEEELDHLRRLVAETGARALKFRLGGRMSRNADSLPGRTEALIPLVRREFGPELTLYADSNSSYDAAEAIRIGRLLEAYAYGFYEEPCEFDDLWSTKQVADAGDSRGRRRTGVQPAPLAVGDCGPRPGHRAARPALRRRLPAGHAGGPNGCRGGPDRGAAHVRGRLGLPGCGAVRLIHTERGPVHGVQGQHRPAGVVRVVVAAVRRGRGPVPGGSGPGGHDRS